LRRRAGVTFPQSSPSVGSIVEALRDGEIDGRTVACVMPLIMTRFVVLISLLFVPGCGSKKSELDGIRDKMCGCKAKSGDRAIRESCASEVEDLWKTAKAKAGVSDETERQYQACRDEIRKGYEQMKADNKAGEAKDKAGSDSTSGSSAGSAASAGSSS
jgi:hypothetical protein